MLHQQQTMENLKKDTITQKPDNSLIETHIKNAENLKISETKSDIDGEHEEMQRAIVNINRKTRPLIKHVSVVKNDILHIDVEKKTVCKLNIHLNEVSNWEDLFNEDDDVNGDFVNQVILSALIINQCQGFYMCSFSIIFCSRLINKLRLYQSMTIMMMMHQSIKETNQLKI